MMDYMYVWKHYGGGRHINATWSPIFEDLYSLEIDLGYLRDQCVFLLCFSLIGLLNTPTPPTMHFRSSLSVKSCEAR